MKADFHVHTKYSPDGSIEPKMLERLASRQRLNCIAVTDHNRLTKVEFNKILFIQGEEIMTSKGELIGLGITEEVPKGLDPNETADIIREQGGVVIIPHPFDLFRYRTALLLHTEMKKPFIVETLNARYIFKIFKTWAENYAKSQKVPAVGGSDAHTPCEIGKAYTLLPDCSDEEEVLKCLKKGKCLPAGGFSPKYVHAFSIMNKINYFSSAFRLKTAYKIAK